jgi:hypothetical protein
MKKFFDGLIQGLPFLRNSEGIGYLPVIKNTFPLHSNLSGDGCIPIGEGKHAVSDEVKVTGSYNFAT